MDDTSANSGRMGFTGASSSPDAVKRVVSSSSMEKKKKKKNSFDQRDCKYPRMKPTGAGNDSVRHHIKKMDPICKTRKKSSISHQLSVDEDVDLEQLDTDGCLDDRDCMWLSSDCSSSTSFFEEHKLSGPFHLVADDCLISRLSTLADSYLRLDNGSMPFNNGSCFDYTKATSLAPKTTSPDTQQILENFQSCDKSLTPTRIDFDSCYQISSDTEGKGYLNLDEDSLVNLNGEDSRWISDTDSEWDNFSFGFPSPSYRSSCGSEAKSSNFSASPTFEVEHGKLQHDLSSEPASEAIDLEDSNEHEPLFWPFGCEHDWSSEEAWKCFSMSPRKGLMIVKTPERTSLRSIGSQLHKLGSAASKILELKQRNNNNKGVKKNQPRAF
ncbi:hypothetical protein EZV62_001433 [Acer yangbiense]|uniref:Uncharacterized protein n=1 Tax=Acer yangbiense TaxID=1000413 RepID=A0A5C7IVG4_9ROSI|nr:hypothetical protein EZV62_001433 [Acer yangbiense]